MRHEPSYDGLRAVSIAGVLAIHIGLPIPGAGMGVEVFFVLSGYLITRLLLDEQARTGGIDLRRFYYRRALRLMPALLTVVGLVWLWETARGHGGELVFPALMSVSYLMNFNRAFGWGPQDPLGHTWSLSMEEQFYIIWPLLLSLTPPARRVSLLAGLIALICAWRGWLLLHGASVERVYNGLDTHAETLLIGCLVALCQPSIPAATHRWLQRVIALPILGMAVQVSLFRAGTPWGQGVGNVTLGLFAGWLIYALPGSDWPRRTLSVQPAVFIGRISYGIYLWHYPLYLLNHEFGIPHGRVVMPLLSIGVATVSYYGLERPILRWRDRRRPPARSASLPRVSPIVQS